MKPLDRPIAVRAYSERPGSEPIGGKPSKPGLPASDWTLVFDCETTVDAAQQLRFGFYQVRESNRLRIEGIFYEPKSLTRADVNRLKRYAARRDIGLVSAAQFRRDVFLKYGYACGGTIVGFNLPFDLSRIAIRHSPARGHMRGGFSFELTSSDEDPRVRVKHLSPKAALIDFAKAAEQDTPRGMRNRRVYVPPFRGHFLDLKTLAAALTSRRFDLASLARFLRTPNRKHDTQEHGKVTFRYLDYARADVQVTWECYEALQARYAEHGLTQPIDRILSEASIGKACLQQMGIQPLLGAMPGVSRELLGKILCAYYGGRAEVRNRRVIREVIYCDFKSMYPTVNSLMGLWDFVIAESFEWYDSTDETRRLIESIDADDFQNRATWKLLRVLVQVEPDGDALPVRAKYDEKSYTIGLNHLTSSEPLWYTLADCLVSKILTGKSPKIRAALTFTPGPPQPDLKPIQILGRPDYQIDPSDDDLFRRLIDLRDEAKAAGASIEKTLKILANSTSYGIFIEVNRDDAPKSEDLDVYGPDGLCHAVETRAVEEPGRYFHPLLGVLITGAARLMLALAERKVLNLGLDWAFCDTDSIAIVRPDGLEREEFRDRCRAVIDWFEPLNPYEKSGSILKLEEINRGIDSDDQESLYCFAISAKRYCLFNLDKRGRPILRKASAHGLGHLLDPYSEEEAPKSIALPRVRLAEIGVRRWQHDLWIKIVEAALEGCPAKVVYSWHPALCRPAAQRLNASTPQILAWLDAWNEGKPYEDQVRPFGFLLSYTDKTGVLGRYTDPTIVGAPARGRPPKAETAKPVSAFGGRRDPDSCTVFDRITDKSVEPEQIKTFAETLAQYHLSPEQKFGNGDFLDQGRTARRHVIATAIALIGKEANRVGESGEAHPSLSAIEELRRTKILFCPLSPGHSLIVDPRAEFPLIQQRRLTSSARQKPSAI